MRYIIIIAMSVFLLIPTSMEAMSEGYPLCRNERAKGGDILHLRETKSSFCWGHLRNERILRKDSGKKSKLHQFAYIFGDRHIKNDFDPIFNVKAKKIKTKDSPLSTRIKIHRRQIEALCGARFAKKIENYFINNELPESSIPGSHYNDYHKGLKLDAGKRLSDFHIWFLNSRGECVRTDDRNIRSSFAIDGVDFPNEQNFLARFLGITPAFATGQTADQYREITVSIVRGTFHGRLYVGNFFVPNDGEYDIIIHDLSTYLARLHRRPPLTITIRN